MYSNKLEELIEAILSDGVITDKERAVLHKRAVQEGVDSDEIDIIINARLGKRNAQTPPPASSVKKDTKHGTLRKCPSCGSPVGGGMPRCPECDYEFTDIKAVDSVTRLSEELLQVAKRHSHTRESESTVSNRALEMVTIINNFPVPNTKEDLLEFIPFTESKFLTMSNTTESDVAILKAYKTKYIECVEKAKIYYPDDPIFQNIFERYESNRKFKWRESTRKTRACLGGCMLIAVMMILLYLVGIFAE